MCKHCQQAGLTNPSRPWGRLWIHVYTHIHSTPTRLPPDLGRAHSTWSPLPWRRGRGALVAGEGLLRGHVRFGGAQLASNKHLHFIHHSLTNGDCGWDQGLTGATSPMRPLKNLATGLYSWLLDTPLASEDSWSPRDAGWCSFRAWERPRVSSKCPHPRPG